MKFDIVTLDAPYRGMGRSLNTDDLLTKKAKEHYNQSIELYFKYIDLMFSAEGVSYHSMTFNNLRMYYNIFKSYGVNCEIIAYDSVPLTDVFGWKIELLGIDVVHDFCESLLEETDRVCYAVKSCLNEWGLLRKAEDMDVVLKNSDCGECSWKACWVYKVKV